MSSSAAATKCRCCRDATAEVYRDLTSQYEEKELYTDMLNECFGLVLSHLDGSTRKICKPCVVRLRDSADFRRLVVRSEQSFLEELHSCDDTAAVEQDNALIILSDTSHHDSDDSWDDNGIPHEPKKKVTKTKPVTKSTFSKDDKISLSILSKAKQDKPKPVVAIPVTIKPNPGVLKVKRSVDMKKKKPESKVSVRFMKKLKINKKSEASKKTGVKSEKALKKRAIAIFTPTSFKGITVKPRTYNIQPICISTHNQPRSFRENNTDDMTESNAALILENSNVCPFKCAHNEYICFYCGTSFSDPELLRSHTNTHKTDNLRRLLHYNRITKIDLTNLSCKLCYEQVPDLNALKEHLTKSHDKSFFSEVGDGVLPFKLTKGKLNCVLCSASFPFFHAVNQHMNEHFPNYVCETCGLGFVEQSRLQVHTSKHNLTGSYPCDTCGKEFKTDYAKKCHIDRIHNKRCRIYCPQCPEKFLTRQQKVNHLVSVHGMEPEIHQCSYCEKNFKIRNQLTLHTRKHHLNDFRFECSYCSKKFFTKNCLDDHIPTHTGERKYKCDVCGKAYPRAKTLKEHMRIHNNDRRFSCSVCGQAFIQKCSLNSHMKTHHSECSGV